MVQLVASKRELERVREDGIVTIVMYRNIRPCEALFWNIIFRMTWYGALVRLLSMLAIRRTRKYPVIVCVDTAE